MSAIAGGLSSCIAKVQAPSGVPPWRSATEPLAPTGNSAAAIPGAASASCAAVPDTVSARSKRSGAP